MKNNNNVNVPNREVDDLSRNIQAAQARENEIYTAIGRVYYSLHSENPEPDFAKMFADKKETELQIEQWQTRIKFLNGVVVCTNCKADNSVNSAFCNCCGTRLPHTIINDGANRCSRCGNVINPGQMFCGTCGAKVETPTPVAAPVTPVVEQVAPVVEPVATPVAPVVEPIPTPVATPVTPVVEPKCCPNCHAVLYEADALFCAECGTRL